jgi:hypothetical protein
MKNISVQYQELQEGKMNKAQFLRNARMMFPSFVTNHNSFDDSVKILKTKGMLIEGDAVKGAPDKEPTYDYPTQPGKYKKVEQSPEVDEQDGIYPATTLTDIPKEKVSKPIKSKTRPDGLEDIKNNDTKNEMKKVKVVKESLSQIEADIAKAIKEKKIDPAKVKAAAEKAMQGDSTELTALMAFGGKVNPMGENVSPEALKDAEKEITKNDASIKTMADKLGISQEELFKMLLKKLGGLKEYNSYDDEPYYSDVPKSTPNKDWDTDDDVSDRYDDYEDIDENEKSFDDVLKNFLDTDNSTEIKAYLKAKGKEAIAKIKAKLPQLKDQARQKLAKLMKVELDEARFKKGTDIGKPGHGFAKIEKAAEKEYGSKEAGQRVAGSILKKVLNKESDIRERLKPAITKLVQEVLDEMGPQ